MCTVGSDGPGQVAVAATIVTELFPELCNLIGLLNPGTLWFIYKKKE